MKETESPAATMPLFTKVTAPFRPSAIPGVAPALVAEPLVIVALLLTVPVPVRVNPAPAVPVEVPANVPARPSTFDPVGPAMSIPPPAGVVITKPRLSIAIGLSGSVKAAVDTLKLEPRMIRGAESALPAMVASAA